MTTIFLVCGKANYTNLSRYSDRSERTYRRHFEAGLGLERLNQALIEQVTADDSTQIAVVDCTFTGKNERINLALPHSGLTLDGLEFVNGEAVLRGVTQ